MTNLATVWGTTEEALGLIFLFQDSYYFLSSIVPFSLITLDK